jgi:hypothetical protein
MKGIRGALIAAGAAVLAYGVWLMVREQTLPQLVSVAKWLVAGVVIHDGVLAPLALGVGWLVHRRFPHRFAAPAAIALILIGTIAVAGFAVLTRSHGGGPNTTLLDRNYLLGLVAVVAVVVIAVIGGTAVASRLGGSGRSGRSRRSRWRG